MLELNYSALGRAGQTMAFAWRCAMLAAPGNSKPVLRGALGVCLRCGGRLVGGGAGDQLPFPVGDHVARAGLGCGLGQLVGAVGGVEGGKGIFEARAGLQPAGGSVLVKLHAAGEMAFGGLHGVGGRNAAPGADV